MRRYKIIGAASGWGAQIRSCEEGPDFLAERGIHIEGYEVIYPHTRFSERDIPLPLALPIITAFNKTLSSRVQSVMQEGYFPIVIGGDHSNAVGTWNGVGNSLQGPYGLLWIDAHMDAHTPGTTPSGAWHGMPLAALLGHGAEELVALTRKGHPILLPEHVCLIGTRSFEEGEAALLKRLNVKIYFMEEVKRRGFKEVLAEAIAYVNRGTCGFGVTLDVDVVDPEEAPGTGCFEPGGLAARELLESLSLFARDPKLKAFELVEFNPSRDQEDRTLQLCQQILFLLTLK